MAQSDPCRDHTPIPPQVPILMPSLLSLTIIIPPGPLSPGISTIFLGINSTKRPA